MNKISGYKLFRLADGTEVELKFANATYELFAERMGLSTLEEVEAALTVPLKEVEGSTQPQMTLSYLKNFRYYVLAAAEYAALAQGKPSPFADDKSAEWVVAEWIEELGYEKIMSAMEKPAPVEADTKKKPKDRLKASQ